MAKGVLVADVDYIDYVQLEHAEAHGKGVWEHGTCVDKQEQHHIEKKPEKGHPQEKNRQSPRSANEVDSTKKKGDDEDDDNEAKTFDFTKKDSARNEKAWKKKAMTGAEGNEMNQKSIGE